MYPWKRRIIRNHGAQTNGATSISGNYSCVAPIDHISYFYDQTAVASVSAFIFTPCALTKKKFMVDGVDVCDANETSDWTAYNWAVPYRCYLQTLDADNQANGNIICDYNTFGRIYPSIAQKINRPLKLSKGASLFGMNPKSVNINYTYTLTIPSATTYWVEILTCEELTMLTKDHDCVCLLNAGRSI